jgi:PPP family 3-phenylpropionic acid transporter
MQNGTLITRVKTFLRTPRGIIFGLWSSYFLYWAALAPVIPYLGVYFESIGLTGSQIGRLGSLRAMVAFISAITLAFLSDLLRRHKLVLIISALGMLIALFLFPRMLSFATLIPVVALYSVFIAPADSVLDEATLRALDNPRDYSIVRMGGSISWGIFVFAAGLIFNLPGVPLTFMFTLHIIFLAVFLVLALLLPETGAAAGDRKRASLADVWELFRFPGFALWMGILFLWGAVEASVINFIFLHIKNIGWSSALMGASMSVGILGEIAGFAAAKRIQGRVGSRRMMVYSLILRVFFFAATALITLPAPFLIVQALGGASFALMQAGSVAYVNERAPRRIGTTAQAVRGSVLQRLSTSVGALICGALYQAYGSTNMFLIMSAATLVTLLFAVILRTCEHRRASASYTKS